MRTANKVWSAIAAGVFCVVAIIDSSHSSTQMAAAPASPGAVSTSPTGYTAAAATPASGSGPATVTEVTSPANLVLADGRQVHVTMMNGVLPWQGQYTNDCERRADETLARTLLLTRPVTVTAPPRIEDTSAIVPDGSTQVDLALADGDYAQTFADQVYSAREAACPTPTPTYTPDPAPTDSGGSDSSGIDVHAHRDHGLPDGALTGGYCRHHRWC